MTPEPMDGQLIESPVSIGLIGIYLSVPMRIRPQLGVELYRAIVRIYKFDEPWVSKSGLIHLSAIYAPIGIDIDEVLLRRRPI